MDAATEAKGTGVNEMGNTDGSRTEQQLRKTDNAQRQELETVRALNRALEEEVRILREERIKDLAHRQRLQEEHAEYARRLEEQSWHSEILDALGSLFTVMGYIDLQKNTV